MAVMISAIFILFILLAAPLMAGQCLECHSSWEEGDDAPSMRFQYDVHGQAGLGCADCHGGDSELDDMDDVRDSRGYKGVPEPKDIPDFCASCHSDPVYMVQHNPSLPTDQLQKYKTSKHGQSLFGRGDSKVANCVSCHSVHNIQKPTMPNSTVNAFNLPGICAACHSDAEYMSGYGLPTNQYDNFASSVHGKALLENEDAGAPACNDCHGNHGATPPGVRSISAVCGTCHALVAERFSHSPHKEAFEREGYPECETCHSNHAVMKPQLSWVSTSESSICVECHDVDDGTRGLAVADEINSLITELMMAHDLAETHIGEADEKGMMVTDENFLLKEVEQALIQAGTGIHTFNSDTVKDITDEGMEKALEVQQAALGKIDDYYFRRKGLAVSTLIITILCIALYRKIKTTDK